MKSNWARAERLPSFCSALAESRAAFNVGFEARSSAAVSSNTYEEKYSFCWSTLSKKFQRKNESTPRGLSVSSR